jgi:hypothetical protein
MVGKEKGMGKRRLDNRYGNTVRRNKFWCSAAPRGDYSSQ